ncbi:hypothetical protein B0I37DRAFT_119001 [Chaetomium sp. MPI-CAGE-AT-0009]|nr:hypothetical protein B0I37DRAFT_119001 [Chaetomium sp. MPI-CAGE-AT-0009]
MQAAPHNEPSPESGPARKKRMPKACGSYRISKVKCDGLRPCSRCRTLRKICEFVERPKDPYETKMEALEREIESLKAQLNTPSNNTNSIPSPSSWPGMPLELGGVTVPVSESAGLAQAAPLRPSDAASVIGSTGSQKRNRAHFEAYFGTFFPGCDRYVPVFDTSHDTLESVRHRSALLFSAICWVGSRVLTGPGSHQSRLLGAHTRRMLNAAIAAPPSPGRPQVCLETVQALLVREVGAKHQGYITTGDKKRKPVNLGYPQCIVYGNLSFAPGTFPTRAIWLGGPRGCCNLH